MRLKKVSRILLLLVVLMISFSMSTSVFGATEISINTNDKAGIAETMIAAAQINSPKTTSSTVANVKSDSTKKANTDILVLFEYSGNTLTFHEENFREAKTKDAKKVITAFINSLKDSDISSYTQQEIMTEIQESDSDVAAIMIPLIFDSAKADLFTAYKWLYPFLQVLRVIFGIGAIVLVLFLLGTTIIDLAYIGLPVWREAQSEKNGSKRPFGVTYEAISTVQEVEKNLGEYKNAYFTYLRRRILSYFFLSLSVLYLVVGELGGVISWLLSLVSGLVD